MSANNFESGESKQPRHLNITASETLSKFEMTLPSLLRNLNMPRADVESFLSQILNDQQFLSNLNERVRGVPGFEKTHFESPADFRLYRLLLYVTVRALRPKYIVETGVLHGFSSMFLLLALEHNDSGQLISLDFPCEDDTLSSQGTYSLPVGKQPGWAIPDYLRARQRLVLGDSLKTLPQVITEIGELDFFLHDSNHTYEHMFREFEIAWPALRARGVLMADNVDLNSSFIDFFNQQNIGYQIYGSNPPQSEVLWHHGFAVHP